MKLLHMTDIHLTTPGNTISGRDPNANFDRALSHALAQHPDAEAIFITGDLSDWGEKRDYERLKSTLDKLSLPIHLCIGNHDDRETFLSVFPEHRGDGGFVQKVVPLSRGHAITLDTWGPDTHAGHFCAARARWLDETLASLDGPVRLFMHHNPVALNIGPMDQIMLLDADRFKAAIAPHKDKIAHIFHGHCHMVLNGSILGIPFSAPRGTNHAGWADFSVKENLSSSDLPEAYSVIFAEPDSTMVVMVEYGYDGAIRSEGSPDYADWDKLTMIR
jgi:3',5'-cyclic AMP phosphodiesterase CpdA